MRYEWQVAEQVQPTAQRHADVPAWMSTWDVWSHRALEGLKLAEAEELAERAARREQALRANLRGSEALPGVLTLAPVVTSDAGSTGGQRGG